MAHTAGIEQFKPFYLDQLPGNIPRTIQCMHDVPPVDTQIPPAVLQTAGSILGLGFDISFMRADMGHDLEYVPTVASRLVETLSVRGLTAYLHGRGCGGEVAMPNVTELAAGKNPDELIRGVASLGLNLSDGVVEQGHNLLAQHRRTPLVPPQDIAAAYMAACNHPVERIDVDGDHLAGHVLVDLTGKPFNTRAAWDAGKPAYNIGFGAMPSVAVEAMGGDPECVDVDLLLSLSAIRHLVTAEAVLHHPEPGQELSILVHA